MMKAKSCVVNELSSSELSILRGSAAVMWGKAPPFPECFLSSGCARNIYISDNRA